jgi:hypothetical protein
MKLESDNKVIPVERISSFLFECEKDLITNSLSTRMLVFVRDFPNEYWKAYTPISMELAYIPDGMCSIDKTIKFKLEKQHARTIVSSLQGAGVEVKSSSEKDKRITDRIKSSSEKDKRITDLQLHNRRLLDRIKFFENILYKTMNVTTEELNQMRVIREGE